MSLLVGIIGLLAIVGVGALWRLGARTVESLWPPEAATITIINRNQPGVTSTETWRAADDAEVFE